LLTAVGSALALSSLLVLDLPSPAPSKGAPLSRLLAEIREGFTFVLARPSLIAVQTTFLVGNFFYGLGFALLGPMVLGQTGNQALAFAAVETAGALGGLTGSALIALWGGPKNKAVGILVGWSGAGLLGMMVLGLGPALGWWIGGAFLGSAVGTLNYASNQALWQSKVPASLQGRVFSVRRLIGMSVMPLASLAAGPLADRVLEPALRPGGALSSWLGPVFGTGPGSGIRVIFFGCGLILALVGPLGWLVPAVRHAEARLADPEAS
jgi:MFS family permease